MHLPINSLLQNGRYRIIKIIGQGGFGCTYQAEHTYTHKHVAVKEFFAQTYCDRQSDSVTMRVATTANAKLVEKLKKKFIDEAVALMNLDHKGIVHVHDAFEENNTAYYIMDFIEGSSLDELIKKQGTLSEKQSLDIIMQVCDALDYVHSHNRLHLDIKPGNIMITPDGKVKLIDFGVSKQYDEVEGNNTSTLMGKTPGYAPVEQMSNAVVNFTPATDIYAVGATLYKMLTGKTPLDATVIAAGETQAPLPSSISPSTRAAVEASMKVIKTQRPQSIPEFTNLLKNTGEKVASLANNAAVAASASVNDTPESEKTELVGVVPPQKQVDEDYFPDYIDDDSDSVKWKTVIIIAIILLIGIGITVYLLFFSNDNDNSNLGTTQSTQNENIYESYEEEISENIMNESDAAEEYVSTPIAENKSDKSESKLPKEEVVAEEPARKYNTPTVDNSTVNTTEEITSTTSESTFASHANEVIVEPPSNSHSNNDKIFTAAEQMPMFPGGESALFQYLSTNIRYPAAAAEAGIQGRVTVQFVVQKDGSIGQVKVLRGKNPDLDNEAVRLVKTLPKFTPGRMNGQAVAVWYTLPINFKLQER